MNRLSTNLRTVFLPVAATSAMVCLLAAGTLKAEKPGGNSKAGQPNQPAGPARKTGPVTRLPELGFRLEGKLTLVWASFPDVPGFTCDWWCYESAFDFLDFQKLEGGRLELRHRVRSQPHVLIVTTATPEAGAVEFVARAIVDHQRDPDGKLPETLPAPNMCWQLVRAEGFRSKPDPYPEFVKRCFIFTDKGRTFLHQTTRLKLLYRDPPMPADDPRNNPPWVQMYVGVWQAVPEVRKPNWANYSPDRYTIPVIGTVSRDGKHLAALANGSAGMMAQAWHDCLHNNSQWLPADAPTAQRRWRLKTYLMPNDPETLLARVAGDFPNAARLKDKRPRPK